MAQPQGFIDPTCSSHVFRLRKAIYGLKQTPRAWYTKKKTFLLSFGFINSLSDTSLFIYNTRDAIIYQLVYVDDLVLIRNNEAMLSKFV